MGQDKSGKETDRASVGILTLDTRFPRIPGDGGNPQTWPFPVEIGIVKDASPRRIVREGGEDMLAAFIEAGHRLVDRGVAGITTTCGFLAVYQNELASALPVPVLTSSLMQVAAVNQIVGPNKLAGILTIAASSLTAEHLAAANVPTNTPIGTTEGGQEFTKAILENRTRLDVEAALADNLEAALALQESHPDLGAIVLECTNMVPYAADIAKVTKLPVYSIETFVTWFQSGLSPRRFKREASIA